MDEEDCNEYGSLRAFIIKPIESDKIDYSKIPTSAEEYLQRVNFEAKTQRLVVKSTPNIEKLRKNHLKNKEIKSNVYPQYILVRKDIQDSIISDFSQLRQIIDKHRLQFLRDEKFLLTREELPDDEECWLRYFFGKPKLHDKDTKQEFSTLIYTLLQYLLKWLENGSIDIVQSAPWVYSLLACIEIPLESNVFSVMRNLARFGINILKNIENSSCREACPIHMIIILIARYFQQFDLIESYRMNY
uniref:Gem-associated protein 2 n=1 Tax=Clastoptera arizonana TaxID=38151 RepID=A0A1B6CSI4_9HEMI